MTLLTRHFPAEILLVEDNPADVRLAREALADAKLINNLNIARDGEEAMEYLRRQGQYGSAVRPDLVLLDLNLPRKDGREVLAEIKSDPLLMDIPVVVLTTSRAEEDVLRSYRLHANAYVAKPVGFSDFIAAIKTLEGFWLAVVTLPPRSQPRRGEAP